MYSAAVLQRVVRRGAPRASFALARSLRGPGLARNTRTFSKGPIKEAEVVDDDAAKTDDQKFADLEKAFAKEDGKAFDVNDDADEHEADSHVHVPQEIQKGSTQTKSFQTETRRILDIVVNSLYTDKEVFLRELISNASDALEKARYMQTTNQGVIAEETPFEIRIYTNEVDKTLIIQDHGVGMSADEVVENLGTIAKSGSKAFAELAKSDGTDADAGNIIGQFGVGFYSVFMVSDKVEVYSQSAKKDSPEPAVFWKSDGSGEYELGEAENCTRGTKIIIHLKEACKEFSIKHVIEGIIKKYSNFVGFPIYLNNSKVNTVTAIWAQDKSTITEEQHLDFYRYIASAYDTPVDRMHFLTDAPIDINALLYFPERHMEKYGMGRLDPGVSLYSRKVLIQAKCPTILPDWLRFVKGVVDSEDIPLNISRENMQETALLQRMNNVLTKKIIKHLDAMAHNDAAKYMKFYTEFDNFIKEGVCTDQVNKDEIAKLLRYDTSLGEKDMCSLDDYISRMPPEQNEIFYLFAPNRKYALSSPYFESFDAAGTEVLFVYSHIDDFVMKGLVKYKKRKLVSIESAKASPNEKKDEDKTTEEKNKEDTLKADGEVLCAFFSTTLKDRLSSVKATNRLRDSPAIVVDHESAAVRKMMKYVEGMGHQEELPKQKMEINPGHSVMQKLLKLKDSNPGLATIVAEQVLDNALIAADILDNPRTMLQRLNKLLDAAASTPSTPE